MFGTALILLLLCIRTEARRNSFYGDYVSGHKNEKIKHTFSINFSI